MKRHVYSLVLLAASCGLAILLAEGIVRVFYPEARDHVTPQSLIEVDSDLGWKLAPGIIVSHHSTVFDVVYRINSFGFRDKPREAVKPANTYRVLLMGDSQIFGWGIDAAARFSNLVEERASGLEVLALGVPGYGLDQEILAYEKSTRELDADEVVLLVSKLTLLRIHRGKIYRKDKPQFVVDESGGLQLIAIVPGRISLASGLRTVFGPLYLPYFLEKRFAARFSRRQPTDGSDRKPEEHLDDLTTELLGKAVSIASERKQKLTLLLDLQKGLAEDANRFCVQNGIECVTLAIDSRNPDNWLGPHDRHWNSGVNLRVAEEFMRQWDRPGGGF